MTIFEQASGQSVDTAAVGESDLQPPLKRGPGRPRLSPEVLAARRELVKAARMRWGKEKQRWEAVRNKRHGAVGRLSGLNELFRRHLVALETLRHVRRVTNGYKVTIQRRRETFEKTVGGSSPQILQKALRIRDEALARLPPRRVHPVVEEVLRVLGLSSPIGGITHFPKRSFYRVEYMEEGKRRSKVFFYRHVLEADAYAAAVEFAEELFTAAQEGRKVSATFIRERDGRMTAALTELVTAGDLGAATTERLKI